MRGVVDKKNVGQSLGVKVREKNTSTCGVGVEERGGGRFEKGRSG